jgi:response regulator RpfG family c-di-GMP phosphodiesterase
MAAPLPTGLSAGKSWLMSAPDRAVPWTVLVVDNDPSIVMSIRLSLRQLDYRVLEAAGPEEALQIALTYPEPIHLVMADFGLPRMNGVTLSHHLLSIRPGLRILYISGYSEEALVAAGFLERSFPFLAKPWRMDELIGRVAEMLEG